MIRLSLVILFNLVTLLSITTSSIAITKKPQTQNKYVYLKSNQVNLRSGPNHQHPISWTIRNRGEPLKVLGTFYHWIQVEDINGHKGWLQTPMTSTKYQYGIVITPSKKPILGYASDSTASRKLIKLEPGVRLQVLKCKPSSWCKIRINQYKAWIPQNNIWGVNLKD
jgi:SH3-like domain-containing protein